jgi:hypothetical protein
MLFRAGLLVLGISLLAAGCGGSTYHTNRADDAYDLEAMALTDADLPAGIAEKQARSFDNEEWANVLDDVNPEAKKNQLDALGRLRSAAKVFSWETPLEHLGRSYQITSQSTLFTSVKAAQDSLKKLCDLPIDDKNPIEEFKVSGVGDEAAGFFVIEQLPNFGTSIDTAICFRTGRIVHAIVASGLDGTQDIGGGVRLAKKMLIHIDAAFEAKSTATKAPGDTRAAPTATPRGR